MITATELSPTERIGLLVWLLAKGDSFTPAEAGELTDCHEDTARRILERLARVIPIYKDAGVFVALTDEGDEDEEAKSKIPLHRARVVRVKTSRYCKPLTQR
jgi:hypothetical protein